MRPDLLKNVPLVCPACATSRGHAHGSARLLLGDVAAEGPDGEVLHGSLECRRRDGCGRKYPIIDGVPILLERLLDYVREERAAIEARRDLSPLLTDLLARTADDEDDAHLRARDLASYRAAHFARHGGASKDREIAALARPFRAFVRDALRRHAPARAGRGLDAGSATGGFTLALADVVEHAIGVDLSFERAREAREQANRRGLPRARRPGFAVAELETPVFPDASFDVALALNVMDAVRRPRALLYQLDACLKPGGLLVLTTPFAYSTARTERDEQIGEDDLLRRIDAGYKILADEPRIPWLLPLSDRRFDLFVVRGIVARKRRR